MGKRIVDQQPEEIVALESKEDKAERERQDKMMEAGLRDFVVIPSKDPSLEFIVKGHDYAVKQDVPLAYILEFYKSDDGDTMVRTVFTLHPGEWLGVGYPESVTRVKNP